MSSFRYNPSATLISLRPMSSKMCYLSPRTTVTHLSGLYTHQRGHGEDLKHTIDYRGVYGTLLEQWMGIDAAGIVGGSFEQIRPFKQSVGA